MAVVSTNDTETERGPMLSATNADTKQTQILFIPSNLPPGVDQAANALLAGVRLCNNVAANAAKTLLPQMIGPQIIGAVPGIMPAPYSGFIDAVGVSARANSKAVADLASIPVATPAVAAVRARAVQMYDMAPTVADKIRLATDVFGLPQLQGCVEVDAFSILPDNVQAAIMDRFLMLSYAAKYGIASKWPAVATPDNPIPQGINTEAVETEARKFVAGIRTYTKQIENCSQIARDCIAYVAVLCQCPVSQAFSLIAKQA